MGKQIKKHNRRAETVQEEPQQQEHPSFDKKTLLLLPSSQQLTLIKEILTQMLANPEEHVKNIDQLFILTKSGSVQVVITSLRALADIFVGTAPLEPVDLNQIKERRQVKITRDEFKVLRFEQVLVNQYQRFLKALKEMNTKLSVGDFQNDQQLFLQFKKCMLQSLLKCFQTLWHFNHFSLLISLLLKFINNTHTCAALSNFLGDKNHATFRAKAAIISQIATLLKTRPEQSLPDQLIFIINNTFIDSQYLSKDVDALKFHKKILSKRLYRQKAADQKKQIQKKKAQKGSLQLKAKIKKEKTQQKLKVRQEVEKQFGEGQATLKKKDIVKANSILLQELYYIYFKVLTERPNSKFLADVLEGILTHSHLININLTQALIAHLDAANTHHRALWLQTRNQHALEARLRVVFTAESLLNGPLSVYNMDDIKSTTALFQILKDINDSHCLINRNTFRLIAISVEQALLKRRQLSQQVAASLLRQVAHLLTHKELPTLYLVQLIRHLASKYSRLNRMFEQDNQGFGLYGFNGKVLDPQATNAINTQLVTVILPLTKQTKKLTPYKKKVIEICQRLLRLTFLKIQDLGSLEDLLRQDLISFDQEQ